MFISCDLGKHVRDCDTITGTEGTVDKAILHFGYTNENANYTKDSSVRSYGTIGCGYETMGHAWTQLDHSWSIGAISSPTSDLQHTGSRPPKNWLQAHPVDLLVVERGHASIVSLGQQVEPDSWTTMVESTPPEGRPRIILESWPPESVSWTNGPTSKRRKIEWENLGYGSRFHLLYTTRCGGAVFQNRLMVARVTETHLPGWQWPHPTEEKPRPMSNLLTPHGLLPRWQRSCPQGPTGVFPDSNHDPMPCVVGCRIQTPHGTRRLQAEELGRALGLSKSQLSDHPKLTKDGLTRTTSVFIWEHLSTTLSGTGSPDVHRDALGGPEKGNLSKDPDWPPIDPLEIPHFQWAPPDLQPGGEWYNTRVRNLQRACATYGTESASLFHAGLKMLDIHRDNFDSEGPTLKRLQLLWWEFPSEHWDAIRDGSRIGFLSDPPHIIHQNSSMDETQLKIAAEYVDELIEIAAVRKARPDEQVYTSTPLFCVPKPHCREDAWRVIADCKAGGQNGHIGAGPVYLNRPLHILEQMYTGGYTAVADASKFFHQFKVHPEDQCYLGLVHPITEEMYVWEGLPMGGGSSPSLAGQYGNSFVRQLRQKSHWFTNRTRSNCWWTSMSTGEFDPHRGYGLLLEHSDGRPAIKIWVFVDDFAIHGPDFASTAAGLREFLDLCVDCGLLVHPKKLKPPTQVQEYTGFIFDTRGPPTLRIPQVKAERAVAMAQYVRDFPSGRKISRLGLSVVAGTLESLADATPLRMGHTYLRQTHQTIHPVGVSSPHEVYYTSCEVPDGVRSEMTVWLQILGSHRGRRAQNGQSGQLIPTWGDGSGTGTGGTLALPDGPLRCWMGQWSPLVYKESSNWKELKTLLLTLQQMQHLPDRDTLRGTTVFYFTDNSATYYVTSGGSSTSPGLHKLVTEVQLVTLDLDISLEVIHVPGLAMILQGTDGLSRGIWMSPFHEQRDHPRLTEAVFAPVPPDMDLARHYALSAGLPQQLLHCHWGQPVDPTLQGCLTIWFPPPELARQCLIRFLESWTELPRTLAGLFFIPRTLSRCWLGLSRFVELLDTIYPLKQPLRHPPLLPIPILVLCIRPHVPVCPNRRMDPIAKPKGRSYPLGSGMAQVCGSAYHRGCFTAGEPFRSRRETNGPLGFPPVRVLPLFVCELCTVRSVIGRELGHPGDRWLLQLERVRIIDMLHNWADGTIGLYQSKLRKLYSFEAAHPGLVILRAPALPSPPNGADIGLMWAELDESIRPVVPTGPRKNTTPVYGTIRQLRSAASYFYSWNMVIGSQGDHRYLDQNRLHLGRVRPTDGAAYSMFARGLSARLGTDSVPSTALLGRHIIGIDRWLQAKYDSLPAGPSRNRVVLAGLANTVLWCSWLRGGENFGLTRRACSVIHPSDAGVHDLPAGVGALLLELNPETKGSRTSTADVVLALQTRSGLDCHLWLSRRDAMWAGTPVGSTGDEPLYASPDGYTMSSTDFRTHYLWPGLEYLRAGGDAFLSAFSGAPGSGNSIPEKFYSCHSYRRGAQTHCQRSQGGGHVKASSIQRYEHARWRIRRHCLPIDKQYTEFTLYERLKITLRSH